MDITLAFFYIQDEDGYEWGWGSIGGRAYRDLTWDWGHSVGDLYYMCVG